MIESSASNHLLRQSYLDEYIGYQLLNTATAFIIVDSTFVVLRFWARRYQDHRIRPDDILVFIALLFCVGLCIDSICELLITQGVPSLTHLGAVKIADVGYHLEAVEIYHPDRLPNWVKICHIVAPVLYYFAVALPKLAILYVFLTIFVDKLTRVCCYVTGAILILIPLVMVPVVVFQCHPINSLWDHNINGTCVDIALFFRYASIPNILTDVMMLVLPIPTVWRLQTSRRVKAGLFGTFLLSSL